MIQIDPEDLPEVYYDASKNAYYCRAFTGDWSLMTEKVLHSRGFEYLEEMALDWYQTALTNLATAKFLMEQADRKRSENER